VWEELSNAKDKPRVTRLIPATPMQAEEELTVQSVGELPDYQSPPSVEGGWSGATKNGTKTPTTLLVV
jgi:hypothetical protein